MIVVRCLLLAVAPVVAQPLRVYSEFAKIDVTGNVVAPGQPREILSPWVVRNGFTSLQIVVQVKEGEPYFLQVGQNPEGSLNVTFYRERGDRLEPVNLPVKGNSTEVFWMDLWAPRSLPLQRIKVEPQLEVADEWWVYPMEARITYATATDPDSKQASYGTPLEIVKGLVCGFPPTTQQTPVAALSMRSFHARNARQDLTVAIAATSPQREGYVARPRMEQLKTLVGDCKTNRGNPSDDPESYLAIRDFILGLH